MIALGNAKQMVGLAMHQSDDLVLVFEYEDAQGTVTRRVVSPIKFLGSDRFLALCLSREEPRQFYLARCRHTTLDRAANYVMPVPMMPCDGTSRTSTMTQSIN